MVKWETRQHMETGVGRIPKTKSIRTPLGLMFCFPAASESRIVSGLSLSLGSQHVALCQERQSQNISIREGL